MLDILEDLFGLVTWLIGIPVRPEPEPAPARVRTEKEQREYDQCNVTLYNGRPRYVSYKVTVKPDQH